MYNNDNKFSPFFRYPSGNNERDHSRWNYFITWIFKSDNLLHFNINITNLIINLGIQVIKMYAWEYPFEKVVAEARRLEIKQIRYAAYIRGVNLSSFVFIESKFRNLFYKEQSNTIFTKYFNRIYAIHFNRHMHFNGAKHYSWHCFFNGTVFQYFTSISISINKFGIFGPTDLLNHFSWMQLFSIRLHYLLVLRRLFRLSVLKNFCWRTKRMKQKWRSNVATRFLYPIQSVKVLKFVLYYSK